MKISGHGTVNHPVTGAAMRTTVFEVEGVGRVGEWLDYGEGEARTVRVIATAEEMREALRETLEALRAVQQDRHDVGNICDDTVLTLIAAITKAEKALGDA